MKKIPLGDLVSIIILVGIFWSVLRLVTMATSAHSLSYILVIVIIITSLVLMAVIVFFVTRNSKKKIQTATVPPQDQGKNWLKKLSSTWIWLGDYRWFTLLIVFTLWFMSKYYPAQWKWLLDFFHNQPSIAWSIMVFLTIVWGLIPIFKGIPIDIVTWLRLVAMLILALTLYEVWVKYGYPYRSEMSTEQIIQPVVIPSSHHASPCRLYGTTLVDPGMWATDQTVNIPGGCVLVFNNARCLGLILTYKDQREKLVMTSPCKNLSFPVPTGARMLHRGDLDNAMSLTPGNVSGNRFFFWCLREKTSESNQNCDEKIAEMMKKYLNSDGRQ